MARFIGTCPIWWLRGHQLSNPAVNTSNARCAPAFTVMLLRTGASCVASTFGSTRSGCIDGSALLIAPPFYFYI
jgi:hypothetical protein